MRKYKKVSELKIKKYSNLLIVSFLLVALFIIFGAAWSSYAVNIYDEEKVFSVKTKQSTVAGVLKEANVTLYAFDRVEPDLDKAIRNNMNIIINRASKVTVLDDGLPIEYYSSANTVEGVLNQTGYTLDDYDSAYPQMDAEVTEDMQIIILRALMIYLTDEKNDSDEPKVLFTCAETVGDLIAEQGIILFDGDSINLEEYVKLKNYMKIDISRSVTKYEEETITIGYSKITRETIDMTKGKTRTVQEGRNGMKSLKYEIKYLNGKEISKTCISTVIVKNPIDQIVEVGTNVVVAEPSGKDFSYSRVLTCSATAYDLSYESCGKHPSDPYYGITASGMRAQYGVIAVDTSVIALGTKLYVEAVDGSWVYGYCVAGDTGSGIKGNKVDLFFNSRNEAILFGRRQANVYVLD